MIKVIYIASPSYSGSTLLSCIMGNHPDIATVCELTGLIPGINIETYYCSCGKLITQCCFWANIKTDMENAGEILNLNDFQTAFYPLNINKYLRWILFHSSSNSYIDTLRDFFCKRISQYNKYINSINRRNILISVAILNNS
jgi:hypothetical protein